MNKQGHTAMPITVLSLLEEAQAVFVHCQGEHSVCCCEGDPGGSAVLHYLASPTTHPEQCNAYGHPKRQGGT